MRDIFLLVILLIFVAGYYSLVTLPRQRTFKKHQRYVMSLQVGDQVITSGGIIGIITELDAEVGVCRLQIAEGVEIKMIAAALVQPYDPEEIARNARMGLGLAAEAASDAEA